MIRASAIAAAVLAAALPAAADDTGLFDQQRLLQDLVPTDGLEAHGITPGLNYTTIVDSNVSGGKSKGSAYFHNIRLQVDVDMEKAAGIPGGRFFVSTSQRAGRNLSAEHVGNIFNVAQICCGQSFKLVDLYWEQSLFDDRLSILLGRQATGDEFLSSPLYWNFLQNGIDGNPVGVFQNITYFAYPNASWAARIKARPTPDTYAMVGFYNGDGDLSRNSAHGADFSMDGPLLVAMEAGWTPKWGEDALPGHYKLGGWYEGGNYDSLLYDVNGNAAVLSGQPAATSGGKTGMYMLLDQMVWKEPGTEDQGLTPFVSVLWAPDDDTNQMPLFINGGAIWKGLIPGRDDDKLGFGVVHGQYSEVLQQQQRLARQAGLRTAAPQTSETVLEWNYTIAAAPWLHIIPDVQYVINPGAASEYDNAVVLGTQISIDF